ncbi:MAG: ATP-binding protein [Holophaga sp.]|jgi:ATP-dependent DNA helicase RecG
MTTLHLDLTPFLAQEEGQFFDRKSLLHGAPQNKRPRNRSEVRDEVATYVAAFANADGGVLILGQEDDRSLTGHAYPGDAVDDILSVPARRLTPPQARGWVQEVNGCQLLVFSVPSAPRAVMVHGDGFPRRVKDTVIQDSEEAINAIKKRGQAESFESDLVTDQGLDVLDPELLQSAAKGAGYGPGNIQDFLLDRGLADWRGAELLLRRAALMLFARAARNLDHPNAGLRIFRVDGVERLTGSRNNVSEVKPRIEGNLPQVIQVAYERIGLLIRTSERLHDLFFKEMPEYPTFAWQEALVNAVAHRDYRDHGRGVEIWLFSDRLEVRSPGDLLPSVTLEALRTRRRTHASRNPRVTRVLSDLGLMREQGEGMPRLFEEMETSWLPMPELKLEGGLFMVILRNTPVFEGGRPEWITFVRQLPLNVRQQRILAKSEGRAFRSAEYQSLNDVDRDQAYRELRTMVDAGYLEAPEHPGPGAVYQVRAKLSDTGGPLDVPTGNPVQAFRLRMREHGFIKNRDYQECFGVARATANRALGEMVEKGVLARSEGTRTYLPGPGWDGWEGTRN